MSEETSKHKIDEIIETLASKLYFHGHPINRREAKDLGLHVAENPQPELEELIWNLYLDYEAEFKNGEIYDPVGQLFANSPAPQPPAPGVQPEPTIPLGTAVTNELRLASVESMRLSSVLDVTKRLVVVGHQSLFEPIIREEQLSVRWNHTAAP